MSKPSPTPAPLKTCPQTGSQVTSGEITYQSTAEGVIEWWRCPACQRWHIYVRGHTPTPQPHNAPAHLTGH